MSRAAEVTRAKLLKAASAEFAEYGIAGARVDRIAEAAVSNKAQIYHHFGSKSLLFDAVFGEHIAAAIAATPIDAYDLPGSAARLAQNYDDNPHLLRLATWQRLERSEDRPVPIAIEALRRQIDTIAEAQSEGVLPTRFDAETLMNLVLSIAQMWSLRNSSVEAASNAPAPIERYQIVYDAVATLIKS